jgi:hypothetical protein
MLLQTRFDAERTLAAIEQHRITHAVMVPTMLIRLVKLPEQVRRAKRAARFSNAACEIRTGRPSVAVSNGRRTEFACAGRETPVSYARLARRSLRQLQPALVSTITPASQ